MYILQTSFDLYFQYLLLIIIILSLVYLGRIITTIPKRLKYIEDNIDSIELIKPDEEDQKTK
jgi:F0F1-type ATP synthase membrane subunit b/b'